MNKKAVSTILLLFELIALLLIVYNFTAIADKFVKSDTAQKMVIAEDFSMMANTLVGIPGDLVVEYPYEISNYTLLLSSSGFAVYEKGDKEPKWIKRDLFLPRKYSAAGKVVSSKKACLHKSEESKTIFLSDCDPNSLLMKNLNQKGVAQPGVNVKDLEVKKFITDNLGEQYIEEVEYLTRLLSIERGCAKKWAKERGAIPQVVINRVNSPGKYGSTIKEVVSKDGGKSWFGISNEKINDPQRGIDGGKSYKGCLQSALNFMLCKGQEDLGAKEVKGRTHFVHRCTQIKQGKQVPSWNYKNPLQVQSENCAAHFSGNDISEKDCSLRKYKPAIA